MCNVTAPTEIYRYGHTLPVHEDLLISGKRPRTTAAASDARGAISLREAVPFACAAYARDDGTLVAANRRFDDEFAALPEHGQREQLLARLRDGALDDAESPEVRAPHSGRWYRSEEHTSELQSLMRISYAVFCLKKKNKKNHKYRTR